MKITADQMRSAYDVIYAQGSSRLQNEGLIGVRYRLPKYFSLLSERYSNRGPLRVLEVGCGTGEIGHMLMQSGVPIEHYVGIDYSLPAVERGQAAGFDCRQMDAEVLDFPDDSFDLVFCFDVMHHVSRPERMAHEMVRVSREHFFLCESNGLSPLRKLGEMNSVARSLGEQSYLPRTYRSFFPVDQLAALEMKPFYVLVPPKVPEALIPLVIRSSEFFEKVPVIRWLGQSLMIAGRKRIAG
jgi:SAM-dependent methyltransferase